MAGRSALEKTNDRFTVGGCFFSNNYELCAACALWDCFRDLFC
jgi:hypothetical protein